MTPLNTCNQLYEAARSFEGLSKVKFVLVNFGASSASTDCTNELLITSKYLHQ